MAGKELILKKGRAENFLIVYYFLCCTAAGALSQTSCLLAFNPAAVQAKHLYVTPCIYAQNRLYWISITCTELSFESLHHWLAHTEIHYLHRAQFSPVLFGFKFLALQTDCIALQCDCNAQSDDCLLLFFSTFQYIVL